MRETRFIEQNKEKWEEFEELLDKKTKDPDKLSHLFIKITDDLSYSRTFYPNRSVRVYLNGLAQQLFYKLYKNRKGKWARFMNFWKEELPQVVYASRKEFLISFIVFVLAFTIGVISCKNDPAFAKVILGDYYVAMTEEFIESGDPMAVYKQRNEVDMFFGITLNNLRVDFLAFVSGLFFAIGTLGILIYNGIMIGAFQFFFIERGLFQESFLTVWTHGTLEISAIIISGAAGLALGKGLVFPGTYSRLQAFQMSARKGIKILMGVIPLTLVAGFLEGFLTRHTETPDFIRLVFILFCLMFVLGYFVYYPLKLAKRGFKKPLSSEKLPADTQVHIDYERVKNTGELFLDTFLFYKKYAKGVILNAFIGAICFVGFYYLLLPEEFLIPFQQFPDGSLAYFFDTSSWSLLKVPNLVNYFQWPALFILNIAGFTIMGFWLMYVLKRDSDLIQGDVENGSMSVARFFREHTLNVFLIVLAANAILFIPGDMAKVVFITLIPVFALWMFVVHKEKMPLMASLSRTFFLLQGSWFRLLFFYLILGIISMVLFLLIDSPLTWLYFEIIQWNANLKDEALTTGMTLFSGFTTVFILNLILPLVLIGMSFLYFTLIEIKDAYSLRSKVELIGQKKKVYGLDHE